jgi:hypothetical protein
MAHPVSFVRVEKQNLIRLGYRLILSKMAYIDAAIPKHEFWDGRALFRARRPAVALTIHVSDSNGRRFQQSLNTKFRHA